MEYGIAFPSMDITDPGAIREFAQGAEALGYKQLSALEHTLGVRSSRDYNPDVTMHEPMVLFGYLAGLTKTIRFSNSILILPQRQTVLVARQAAEIDALSGGRMTLGVGIGSNADEAAGMGTEYHTRGARVEEQAALKMDEVKAHLNETTFAWIGSVEDDAPFYYRVHSPVVVVEFDHQSGTALDDPKASRHHIHSILRTPNGNDYGADLLRQHHEHGHAHS